MNTTHKDCQHPKTKNARAYCRRQRSKFMMTDEMKAQGLYWTVAYRRSSSERRAHRIPLALSWYQAQELANVVAALYPDHRVYYVTNIVWDCDNPYHEDAGHLLDDDERIPYVDDGVLPASAAIMDHDLAKRLWDESAI